MRLVDDDHVIETLAANGSDQPFNVWALPRAHRTGDHFRDPHARYAATERLAVDAVAISQQPVPKGQSEAPEVADCKRCIDLHARSLARPEGSDCRTDQRAARSRVAENYGRGGI